MMDTCPARPIWLDENLDQVRVIDQRKLPRHMEILTLDTVDAVIESIVEMVVRGAPLIGVTGAYGIFVALKNAGPDILRDAAIHGEAERIKNARPTAVNLVWAVDRMMAHVLAISDGAGRIEAARREAARIADEEAENSRAIGDRKSTRLNSSHYS